MSDPFSPQSLLTLADSGLTHAPPTIQSAYRFVLRAEATARTDEERVDARVVGFFMTVFWRSRSHFGDTPVARITNEVNSMGQPAADQGAIIYRLGTLYRQNLLRAFRSSKGPLPLPSSHPSRPSFDSVQQFITEHLQSSPKDYRTAKKYALARDGFKCMLSHKFDATSVRTIPAVKKMMRKEGRGYEATNCCHIFSESAVQDIDSTDPAQVKRREYAATALAMLKSFGLNTLVDKILQRRVHDPTNLLTMSAVWHTEFDNLQLWLEGTSTPNEYDICVAMEDWWNKYPKHPRRVLFVSRPITIGNETRTPPLPDPQILAIHATCARVAQMSGAAKYMDEYDQELDNSTVLAADGSSAAFFNQLLLSASLQAVLTHA
uniref:HNH nuclease domain-containing protein n=3 Tax=Moniliophthora roreri TaxID=221103 RepID=A0A0W0GCH1_MONRR